VIFTWCSVTKRKPPKEERFLTTVVVSIQSKSMAFVATKKAILYLFLSRSRTFITEMFNTNLCSISVCMPCWVSGCIIRPLDTWKFYDRFNQLLPYLHACIFRIRVQQWNDAKSPEWLNFFQNASETAIDQQWSTMINSDQQWSTMINNDQQRSTMINSDQT
jgi:hypothetical protein